MRRIQGFWLTACLAFTLPACTDTSGPAAATLSGTYTLRSVAGQVLPVTLVTPDCYYDVARDLWLGEEEYRITAGSLTVLSGDELRLVETAATRCSAAAENNWNPVFVDDELQYSVSGRTLTVFSAGGGSLLTGTIIGDTIRVNAGVEFDYWK